MITLCSIIYISWHYFIYGYIFKDGYYTFYLHYRYTFIDGMLYSYDTSWIYVYIMYNM